MAEPRRVVITGIGAITPIGIGVEGLWSGLEGARSAVREITRFDPAPFRTRIAAQVDDFHASDHIEERKARRIDRFGQFSVAASRMALADAELDLAREDRDRIGVMMGTALGGVGMAEEQHARYVEGGVRAVDPGLALMVFAGAASCNVAIAFGVSGPNSTNGMSCASGTIAIGDGFRAIVRGDADVMLAGGAEAPLAPLSFGAFAIIRAMSTRNDDPGTASRPFDAERDGFVMGEGAAVLVLEERRHALARGARIYAELCGYGLTNDAHHMTAPRADGAQAARAMRMALAEAAVRPAAVGYVNAHGSSTPLNTPPRPWPSGRCSASTPSNWPSAAPRATTATPSEPAAPSRRPSAPWRATGAGSRRRSTSRPPTPPATSTTSRRVGGLRGPTTS
ncbi:MAG TPA: beta-ketoacyl synthase N-terminal-like domain-containing protein [Gemmatimonadales bacterium]|nr:beta-ketoacyl synthase N-terminal-like domain-containing protein [Gemmatimonadales bacterium]